MSSKEERARKAKAAKKLAAVRTDRQQAKTACRRAQRG